MMRLTFVTSNQHKFDEACSVAREFSIELVHRRVVYEEIQHHDLEVIARASVTAVRSDVQSPFFLEDTGLFVDELKGFPGPFAAYVNQTVSWPGVLRLMEGVKNRAAHFKAIIAYSLPDGSTETVTGVCQGSISTEGRGSMGFGFDPIFIPDDQEEGTRTFAEMDDSEKARISHRGKALRAFLGYFKEHSL